MAETKLVCDKVSRHQWLEHGTKDACPVHKL